MVKRQRFTLWKHDEVSARAHELRVGDGRPDPSPVCATVLNALHMGVTANVNRGSASECHWAMSTESSEIGQDIES